MILPTERCEEVTFDIDVPPPDSRLLWDEGDFVLGAAWLNAIPPRTVAIGGARSVDEGRSFMAASLR